MQDAMMGAAKADIFKDAVGVAHEIPIGEKQQFDQIEHGLGLFSRRRSHSLFRFLHG
jgi:hypothetical protein